MEILSIHSVCKSFKYSDKENRLLDNINFTVNQGEIVGVRGGNGKGKTTLMNIITGVTSPTSGKVHFDKDEINYSVVFQDYGSTLLPWLNAKDNILLPLKILKKGYIENKLEEVINLLGFTDLPLNLFPNQLSGGQKQKVAISRALINSPSLIILDEPFSSIDFRTSIKLLDCLNKLKESHNISILIISHNIDELLYVCDRILLLGQTPTTIIEEYKIPFERPRQNKLFTNEAFAQLRNKIVYKEYEISIAK